LTLSYDNWVASTGTPGIGGILVICFLPEERQGEARKHLGTPFL
jgi:hypothetical protein